MSVDIIWPLTLPQLVLPGPSIKPAKGFIRSSPDAGIPFVRPRYTAVPRIWNVTVELESEAQVLTALEFYEVDLAQGTRRFQFPNPLDIGQYMIARYMGDEAPEFVHQQAYLWRSQWLLEVLP